MTHEILFRGKRIDNGEWDYGYPFISDTDGSAYILRGSREFTPGHEVAPDTLKPYTGLIDKNGVKIFVGDIVKFEKYYDIGCYPHWKEEIEQVRYEYGCFYPFKYFRQLDSAFCKIEVIGNIYDNPELLEVQHETD